MEHATYRIFAKTCLLIVSTVKPVLSGHSLEDQKLTFKTDNRLIHVKSIAECSMGEHSAILLTCIKGEHSAIHLICTKRLSVLKTNFWSFELPLTTGFYFIIQVVLFYIRIQKRRRHLSPHPIHGNQNLSRRHPYHLMSYISHRLSLIENMSSGHCAHLSSSHLFINKEKVSLSLPI